ncbi:hypothetical protein [Massilia frigida]|uniref:hypothetical protein n=1 Tax=Massilia frigida TaxID=2609281 RepID=UPI0014208BDE|nr:hypothetical protein [Massilia frigida]
MNIHATPYVENKMRRFALSFLLLMFALTALAATEADKYAAFHALTRDLAANVEATAARLHAEGIQGYAPGSDRRSAVERLGSRLEKFSRIPAPTEWEIRNAGYVLGGLIEEAPEVYAAVINEPAMLARLHSAELSMGMEFFVSPGLLAQGMKILDDLLALAKTSPIKKPAADKEEELFGSENIDDMVSELKKKVLRSQPRPSPIAIWRPEAGQCSIGRLVPCIEAGEPPTNRWMCRSCLTCLKPGGQRTSTIA